MVRGLGGKHNNLLPPPASLNLSWPRFQRSPFAFAVIRAHHAMRYNHSQTDRRPLLVLRSALARLSHPPASHAPGSHPSGPHPAGSHTSGPHPSGRILRDFDRPIRCLFAIPLIGAVVATATFLVLFCCSSFKLWGNVYHRFFVRVGPIDSL